MRATTSISGLVFCVTVLLPLPGSSAEKGPTIRDYQQAACYNDALRICGDFVPDEIKVTVCMRDHKTQLSAQCVVYFPPDR